MKLPHRAKWWPLNITYKKGLLWPIEWEATTSKFCLGWCSSVVLSGSVRLSGHFNRGGVICWTHFTSTSLGMFLAFTTSPSRSSQFCYYLASALILTIKTMKFYKLITFISLAFAHANGIHGKGKGRSCWLPRRLSFHVLVNVDRVLHFRQRQVLGKLSICKQSET